jgi:hypothetical protein
VRALAGDDSAEFAYGDALRFNQVDGQLIAAFQAPVSAWALAADGSLIQPTVFWRRRLSDAIGPFDASLRYVADLEYWLRATRHFRAILVDEILAVDRVHANALSSRQASAMALESAAVRRRFHRGPVGMSIGIAAARIRAVVWARVRAERFARATRKHDPRGPWGSFIAACGPRVAPVDARLRRSRRLSERRSLTWEHDPIAVASAARIG